MLDRARTAFAVFGRFRAKNICFLQLVGDNEKMKMARMNKCKVCDQCWQVGMAREARSQFWCTYGREANGEDEDEDEAVDLRGPADFLDALNRIGRRQVRF